MAGRRHSPDLDSEERALWQRVTETVRPIAVRRTKAPLVDPPPQEGGGSQRLTEGADTAPSLAKRPRGRIPPPRPADPIPVSAQKPLADSLDGGWDRRIRRGSTEPERTIDLHGHTLLTAHRALDIALDDALRDGIRVLLVITGKPPRESDRGADGRAKRGLIRASIGDWLTVSRHARRIAAVRNAHPRHGGTGALYVILKRDRG